MKRGEIERVKRSKEEKRDGWMGRGFQVGKEGREGWMMRGIWFEVDGLLNRSMKKTFY